MGDIVVLINEYSYSDAEVFPSAVKERGLGTLIGTPTLGFVIAVTGHPLIDGGQIRKTFIGIWEVSTGAQLESRGAIPDIFVESPPEMEKAGTRRAAREGDRVPHGQGREEGKDLRPRAEDREALDARSQRTCKESRGNAPALFYLCIRGSRYPAPCLRALRRRGRPARSPRACACAVAPASAPSRAASRFRAIMRA